MSSAAFFRVCTPSITHPATVKSKVTNQPPTVTAFSEIQFRTCIISQRPFNTTIKSRYTVRLTNAHRFRWQVWKAMKARTAGMLLKHKHFPRLRCGHPQLRYRYLARTFESLRNSIQRISQGGQSKGQVRLMMSYTHSVSLVNRTLLLGHRMNKPKWNNARIHCNLKYRSSRSLSSFYCKSRFIFCSSHEIVHKVIQNLTIREQPRVFFASQVQSINHFELSPLMVVVIGIRHYLHSQSKHRYRIFSGIL